MAIGSFNVSDQAVWDNWVANNSDDGYGQGVIEYAARWASAMDSAIANGANLEDVAMALSFEADTDGITGFMYGMAVKVLASCWAHGEALRVWHNAAHGVSGDGVVNPAVLVYQSKG